jgi:hypothetical protein
VLWPAPLSFKNFLSSSAAPIIIRPEELAVNLLRPYQVLQLFEARKRPVFKDIFRHVDPLEKIVKLLRPPSHVPATSEPGQMFANLLKGHAVAPIILAGSSKTYTTARKDLAYYVCNLAHTIVMRSIANIEYFIVNRFAGSLQHRDNCTRNVQPMDQRPPRCPIASHLDLLGRPRQSSQVAPRTKETRPF